MELTETEQRKQQEFIELAQRFREEKDPAIAKRLGDELGRIVFSADTETREQN